MTSGNRLISVAAIAGFLFAALALNASAATWTVETLIELIKEQRADSVAFEETTYSSLLIEPVKARGFLKFVPPERLEKMITTPSVERYIVDGDRVIFENARKGVNRTVSLEDYPALRSFVFERLGPIAATGQARRIDGQQRRPSATLVAQV